jgi:copper chaperone CopZ
MHNTRNEVLIEGEESIASWSRLQESNRGKADELSSAMIEATFAKVDPDPKGKGHDAKKLANTTAGKKAQAAWDALTAGPDADAAVKIYRDVREFYEKRMNEYIRVQLNRLAQKQKADGASDAEIKDALKKKLDEIEESIIKPYFPIKRFGEFWLQIGKGKNKIFMQFEDAAARNLKLEEEVNRISRELMNANPSLTKEKAIEEAKKELDAGNSFSTEMNRKLAELEHLKEINKLVNSTTENVQTSKEKSTKNQNFDQLDFAKDEINND